MKKLLVFALCALCVVALIWIAEPVAPDGVTALAPESPAAPVPMAAAGDAGVEAPPQRSELPRVPPAVTETLAPHRYALEIHTRDEDDLPVAGAKILIGPAHHELNSATADDDGVVRLSWRGRVPSMAVVFGSADDHGGRRLRRLVVTAGTTAVAPLRLKRRGERRGNVVFLRIAPDQGGGIAFAPDPPSVERDDDGIAWFATRGNDGATAQETINLVISNAAFHNVRFSRLTLFANPAWQVQTATQEKRAPTTGSVAGVVRDALGRPVHDVLVQVGPDRERRSPWSTRTAEDGSFAIEKIPAGSLQLRAGGGDHGLAFASIEVVAGEEVKWLGILDRGLELAARLEDGNGAPLAKWAVEARPQGDTGTWIDGAVTDEQGRFAIPNVAPRPYSLRLRPENGVAFGFRLDGVWPGAEPTLAVLGAELSGGELRALPVRPDGTPVATVELRLWLDALDEGVRATSNDAGRPCTVEHLCPGLYTVAAGGPGIARHDVAQVQVAAGPPTDIGSVALPEPCVLALPEGLDPGEDGYALLRLHAAVPSRAGALARDKRARRLPPGRYLVRDGETDRQIEIAPGPNTFVPQREAR